MTRVLAIVCVFLIVIGLYSHWRYPAGLVEPTTEPVVATDAETPADTAVEPDAAVTADTPGVDQRRRPKQL